MEGGSLVRWVARVSMRWVVGGTSKSHRRHQELNWSSRREYLCLVWHRVTKGEVPHKQEGRAVSWVRG